MMPGLLALHQLVLAILLRMLVHSDENADNSGRATELAHQQRFLLTGRWRSKHNQKTINCAEDLILEFHRNRTKLEQNQSRNS